jgi:hypothetical protein
MRGVDDSCGLVLRGAASPVPSRMRSEKEDGMSDSMNRRAFLGTMATTVAAAELLAVGRSVRGATAAASAATPGTHTSFSSIKQIDAGLLNVRSAAPSTPATRAPVEGRRATARSAARHREAQPSPLRPGRRAGDR